MERHQDSQRLAAEPEEGERLRGEAARIDELLGELGEMTGPPAWQRLEELVQRIVGLYGAGLGRLLKHLADAGAMAPEIEERLVADETVASLLLLHGLHPHSMEERVRRAVESVKSQAGAGGLEVEVVRAEPEGVELKLTGAAAKSQALEATLRRALEEVAPDAERIEIEGAASHAEHPAEGLVTIDLSRSRGGSK